MQGEKFVYYVIGISEIYKCQNDSRLSLPGYHKLISRCRSVGNRGGVGIFKKDSLNYCVRDISVYITHICETVFIEIKNDNGRNTIAGVMYRPNTEPHADIDILSNKY